MKIEISEDEVYEIKMPEKIGIEDFQEIVARFNFLIKNFTKFSIGESQKEDGIVLRGNAVKTYGKQNRERWNTLRDNKDIYFELLKTYFFDTVEDFEKVLKKYNLDFKRSDMSSGQMVALREHHKLEAKDFGLRKFPTRNEQIKDLMLGDNEK